MSTSYGPRIITDGLVLCVDAADRNSYVGSGNNWRDVSNVSGITLDTNLVIYENNTFKATDLNQYIWFGGTNPALQNLTSDGNSHTFECWWMPLGTPPGADDGYFCGRRGDHSGHRQVKANGLQHNCILWYASTPLSVGSIYTYPSYGVWGHLCYVVDEVNNIARYYVNGNQQGADAIITAALRNYGTGDYHLFSGAGTNWSGNGRLGTVRFYNKALSPFEIRQNFNASKSRFGF
jgi:stress response protein SCP2